MKCDRAKIFSPFSPLKGLEEAYREKEKIIYPKAELLTDREEELNFKLNSIQTGDTVQITHYTNGAYKKKMGRVSAILPDRKIIIIGTPINFSDIYDIEILYPYKHT